MKSFKQLVELVNIYHSGNEWRKSQLQNPWRQEITCDVYEDISDSKIATIIKEYHDVKVTDTLIESYLELASSKMFTVDPIATDIRSLNKFDKLVEGKIDYILEDGSIVAINEETQLLLNKLLQDNNDIILHMRESKENFLQVIQQIEGQ